MEPIVSARAGVVFALVLGAFAALGARTAWLLTEGRQRNLAQADRQQTLRENLPARRGSIFDSTGQLLAGSLQVEVVFVDPKFLIDQFNQRQRPAAELEAALDRLAPLVERDPFDLLQLVSDKYPGRYVELRRDVDSNTADAVRKLNLPGVGITRVNVRRYPQGSLAAHVIGAVGTDGKGLEGVELKFNTLLSGTDGYRISLRDARRRSIETTADDYVPPTHGNHLVLTIDARIQRIVETELAATVSFFGASGGECVVMDPQTGAVLALANVPTFDPLTIRDSTQEQRTNRSLVLPYEPGSTLKPFIVAKALDEGVVKLDQMFEINGPTWKTDYNRTINDVHGYSRLITWDVLTKSSNIGMAMIAARMGQPMMYQGLTQCGIGRRSGIDLPGEDAGLLAPVSKWNKYSTESIAQGYELLVTPIQMARGMCVFANGGRLVQPFVVRGTLEPNGTVKPIDELNARTFERVISTKTAADMLRVLADIPIRGTARHARLKTYNIFGKTGTAHRAVNGRYNDTNYTASFVGGGPYENPRLVIAFVIHDPKKSKSHFGGIVAAPAAGRILEKSLQTLGVPHSPPLAPPPASLQARLYQFDPRLYADPNAQDVANAGD